jgi:hypothetical protein
MIPVFERAKTVHVLDRAASVIGYPLSDTADKTWEGEKGTQILLSCIHLVQARTYEKKFATGPEDKHPFKPTSRSTVHSGNNATSDTAGNVTRTCHNKANNMDNEAHRFRIKNSKLCDLVNI